MDDQTSSSKQKRYIFFPCASWSSMCAESCETYCQIFDLTTLVGHCETLQRMLYLLKKGDISWTKQQEQVGSICLGLGWVGSEPWFRWRISVTNFDDEFRWRVSVMVFEDGFCWCIVVISTILRKYWSVAALRCSLLFCVLSFQNQKGYDIPCSYMHLRR